MSALSRLLLKTLLFFLLFLSSTTAALAADFDAVYKVAYDVSENGLTHVNQEVSLVNTTKNRYATKYNLSIGSTNIKDIRASDSLGQITPEVTTKEDTTEIGLSFNDKVIGLGKSLNFSLNYNVTDAAAKNGRLWEINIPKIATEENVTDYSLSLKVPESFGLVHYITPEPIRTEGGKTRVYFFKKEQLFKSSVAAVFGDAQYFDLTLKYHLYNPNLFNAYTEIVLPPDTGYQQVTYLSIEPKPLETLTDKDGNYLARYSLEGNKGLDVKATLQIKTVNNPLSFHTPPWKKTDLSNYLRLDRYWETNHPVILEKAKQLKTPEKIFDFVSSTLKYGYNRIKSGNIERFGAVSALNNPEEAICMEFTDLTIALLRAAGIPARELNGFAYTSNQKLRPVTIGGEEKSDVLHAWLEYYDEEKGYWVQIDPTWTSTTGGIDYFNKLDNNHLVFVIKGLSSEKPHPAGSYKYADQKEKDVQADFAKEIINKEISLLVGFTKKNVISGFPSNTSLKVQNESGRAIIDLTVSIKTPQAELLPETGQKVNLIAPFSSAVLDLKLREKDLFAHRDEEAKIVLRWFNGSEKIEKEFVETIKIQPLYIYARLPILLILIPLFLLLIIMFILKTQVRKLKKG